MGSKTPDGQHQGPNGASASAAIASINPPKSDVANGLNQGILEGEDDDEDGDDSDVAGADVKTPADGEKKKKKRKPKKKKKKTAAATAQSSPPRVPLANLFPGDKYPEGQIVEYAEKNDNLERTTKEELRHLSLANNMDEEFLRDYRKAAETHRQVRKYAQSLLKPGVSLHKVREEIDEGVLALVGHPGVETGDPLKGGLAFPTGFCINHIAAHWTPNNGAKEVILQQDDVLSVDFGVHVNGRIVDSAFTVAHNPQFDPLLNAVKAATNTGLKEAGIDARIDHISAAIQEVMQSYEVTINKKTIPVKAVRNITGHNILRYKVHGGKSVPFIKTQTNERMEEGDIFAIETFGTTGSGRMRDDIGVYGYSRNEGVSPAGLRTSSARGLLKTIDENFGTIPFSRASLERLGVKNYLLGMKALVDYGIVESYAPLVDVQGSYVAQFEHTVLLRSNCKEIVSRGDDY